MKVFIDTEFLEGTQKTFFGKSKPTIDLISIGLVAEDGREFYAISKEFNLKEAWNRHQLKEVYGDARNLYPEGIKEYWIRENVLKPIWKELSSRYLNETDGISSKRTYTRSIYSKFSYDSFCGLIGIYGKTKNQIAGGILNFINSEEVKYIGASTVELTNESVDIIRRGYLKPEFYGYYCDYDWVCFCWLFGKMISLPQGFPMYCRDLKQTFDEKQKFNDERYKVGDLKKFAAYPKQLNEHNALADAKWNFELYKFLEQL
jgi:hypothetical protein